MATISEVFRPLGDQKVAGGVVTVAPTYLPRNGPLTRDEILITPVRRMRGLSETC